MLSLSVPSCRALPHSHFLMILDGWPRSVRYHRQKSVHVLQIARRVAGIPKFGYHETPLKSTSCEPFFRSCRCPLLYRVTPSGKWKRRIGLSFFLLSRQTTCRGLGEPPRRGPGHVLKLWEGGERETKFIPSPTSNFPVDCQCGRGEWRGKFQHLMRFDAKFLDLALLLFA